MCLATQAVLAYLRHLYRTARNHTGPAEVLHISQAEYPTKPKITFDTLCSNGISSPLPWLPSLLMANQSGHAGGHRTLAHEPLHEMSEVAGQSAAPCPYDTQLLTLHLHLPHCTCSSTAVQVATPAASLASWCPCLEKANHFPGLKYAITN